VSPLAQGIGFTNGPAYDAERRRLYCSDTFHATLAFDVGEDWALTNHLVFFEREDFNRLKLDSDGTFRSPGLAVPGAVAPDGTALPRVQTLWGRSRKCALRVFARLVANDGARRRRRHAEGRRPDHRSSLAFVLRPVGHARPGALPGST
jgi:hypothetical protein